MFGLTAFKTSAAAAVIAAASWAGAASATTVEYVGTGQGTTYTIAFDDDTSGQIGVTVTATGSSADMLGLGFDWGGSALDTTLPDTDFVWVSSNTGQGITNVCTDTLSCGPGLNFNGALPQDETFDYIVRMGASGSGGGLITDFSFYILTDESLDDVLTDSFGIRAQSTEEGSIKLVDFTRVAEVPLPAAGFLLLGGLGALGAMKRRRKAA